MQNLLQVIPFASLARTGVFGALVISVALLSACSTNPATGEQQFTALMPAAKEAQIGAQEHEKVKKTYGILPQSQPLAQYVSQVGQAVAAKTERPDVRYKFHVVDDPMVNAFALPGGYIYVSRGLLAQANSEAELAAVLAHEVGHVTARHSAERYSQSVLASLGTLALGVAIDNPQAGRLAGLGSELYIKSYSRGQEYESDDLGVRYLTRAGYTPYAMAGFLESLSASDALERKLSGGQGGGGFSFFSTHPQTEDRVSRARQAAARFAGQVSSPRVGHDVYLQNIDGMVYGHSRKHGFIRGQNFYHPELGFSFTVPDGFTMYNQPDKVVASAPQKGATIIFDAGQNPGNVTPDVYLSQVWMKGESLKNLERITINGKPAATASFDGQISNRPVTVRLVAVSWAPDRVYRFQMAYPRTASQSLIEDLQRTTYSLEAMTEQDARTISPYTIQIVKAQSSDSVNSLAARLPYEDYKIERFRVLNGLKPGDRLEAGRLYKVIAD